MFSNITDKIRLFFRKDKEPYLCFYRMLGFYPRNIEIYQQALLHKSSSVKEKGRLLNNERLEFLGDAILDAVVADIVYKKFEGKREGFLTGKSNEFIIAEFKGDESLIGQFVNIKVTDSMNWAVTGEII